MRQQGQGHRGSGRFGLSSPSHVPFPHALQKVVLSSAWGPQLHLPLVLGAPLQLKLAASGVTLSQGPETEILALPLSDPDPLLNLWVQPHARLFLGALPGTRILQHIIGVSQREGGGN